MSISTPLEGTFEPRLSGAIKKPLPSATLIAPGTLVKIDQTSDRIVPTALGDGSIGAVYASYGTEGGHFVATVLTGLGIPVLAETDVTASTTLVYVGAAGKATAASQSGVAPDIVQHVVLGAVRSFETGTVPVVVVDILA